MQRIDIFVKKGYYFNLSSGMTGDKWNMPMYNRDIKLFKGIENKVQFSVRDHDRKAYHLRDRELYLNIINQKLNSKLVKQLWCVDAYKGIFEVTFTESEMRDFEPATYTATVYTKDLEGNEDLLYSGTDWTPVFYIHVVEGVMDVFKPSHKLNPEEFLHNFYVKKEDGQRYDYYVSSRIKADETEYHTASITVIDDFLGTITMEGSMEVNPTDSEADWFIIDSKEYTDETKVEGETFQFNSQLNCMWVRFKYTVKAANTQGKVSEILYRN